MNVTEKRIKGAPQGWFALFWSGIDKSKAKRGKRRISEAALLTASFLMGGVGGLLGMLICRHKTKHWYFCLLVPIFAVLSVGAVVLTYIYCG